MIEYKARLVAQGFTQKPGTDFSNMGTFAPVMRFETLRTLLALAAVNGWHLCQMDVKEAYLNGRLTEELYMKQPTGFEDGTGRVCRLVKSIYGLKQAGNVWNHDLNSTMLDFRYMRLRSDYCAYILRDEEKSSIAIVWVDDMVGIADTKETNDKAVEKLAAKYKIKVIGEPNMLLGMHITRDYKNRIIRLSQAHYIHQMLKEFGMENMNTVSTPMDPNVIQHHESHDVATQNGISYATYIGKLLYAAHATRPDILYATVTMAQFAKDPSQENWTGVKRILRYLKGTIDFIRKIQDLLIPT
jgi:hypothetical protein